jgi:4-diphosphocytidyl-2-C-methyl-D-erythritol kinase
MEWRTFYAPAKVNLCLHVEARRADGYHELCMIMQKVSLADTLDICVEEGHGVELICGQVPLAPGEENIAVRAARLLLAAQNLTRKVTIRLTKKIPIAAGLGGGSSDAATVLRALNDWLPHPVPKGQLAELALKLGADVPFFLQDDTVWARGIGERFSVVRVDADYCLLLVNPGVPVATAAVYGGLTPEDFSTCSVVDRIVGLEALCGYLHNDLERVALQVRPVIATVKNVVAAHGAQGVLMSGSGATVFGLFAAESDAFSAAESIRQEHDWWCEVVYVT